MKKQLLSLTLVFVFAVLLSACSLPGYSSTTSTEVEVSSFTSPTPTVSKNDSVDTMEADLDATVILEEDFSDIK